MLTDEQIQNIKMNSIYRFRNPTDYNFKALLEEKIYASTPNALNDPLDCGITYNLDVLYEKLISKKRFIDYFAYQLFKPENAKKYEDFENIKSYTEYSNSVSTDCEEAMTDSKNKSIVKNAINDLTKEIIFELRDCFGVVSFSLVPGNGVMWSHYASNYTGFVLGYDLKSFNDNVNALLDSYYLTKKNKEFYGLHLMKYVPQNEMIDGTQLMYELISKKITKKNEMNVETMLDYAIRSKHSDVFLSILTTKDVSWNYEKEIRLVLPREDYRFNPFHIFNLKSPSFFEVAKQYAPSEIIVGNKMSKIHRAIIGYYVSNNNRVNLWEIDDSKVMSEKSLYKNRIKVTDLLK